MRVRARNKVGEACGEEAGGGSLERGAARLPVVHGGVVDRTGYVLTFRGLRGRAVWARGTVGAWRGGGVALGLVHGIMASDVWLGSWLDFICWT